MLIYMSQLSVDTAHHVITDIWAYHADKKDNQYLEDIIGRCYNPDYIGKGCFGEIVSLIPAHHS